MKDDNQEKNHTSKLLVSRMAIIIYVTFIIEFAVQLLYIFGKIDSNIYFNTSFLIIEITVGISIAIIVHDRTKKSEKRIENTLDDIKTRAIQIDQAVVKIENIEKQQHEFLEKEKTEKKKREVYAYYEFGREFSHINRYLKNLEEALEHNPKSDEDLNHHRDLALRYIEATNNSISNIRRIADIFRLDVEFDFQMRLLIYVNKLEIDIRFIRQGSSGFLPLRDGLMDELKEIITTIDEYINKRKKEKSLTPI